MTAQTAVLRSSCIGGPSESGPGYLLETVWRGRPNALAQKHDMQSMIIDCAAARQSVRLAGRRTLEHLPFSTGQKGQSTPVSRAFAG